MSRPKAPRPQKPPQRCAIIFGTRPEAIKLCPLVRSLREHTGVEAVVCVTGQHRGMLDPVLAFFEVTPDVDLNLMRPDQTLAEFTSRAVHTIDGFLAEHDVDVVIVQGDTTTAFSAALSAFYRRIPVAHVEAGLRSGDKWSPFPEEANRVLTSYLSDLHFAPTSHAKRNLLASGVQEDAIHVTGNTSIDALLFAVDRLRGNSPRIDGLPDFLQPASREAAAADRPRSVLITAHRRESFGQGLEGICEAVAQLARAFPDVHFVYPLHLNPRARQPVDHLLRERASGNLHVIEPLDYQSFAALMDRATLLLTDSGGVQEEAPSLGKPVLVMRNTTERPEALEVGAAKLVGTETTVIVREASRLLTDEKAYREMVVAVNPYGDGRASERIAAILAGQPVTPF